MKNRKKRKKNISRMQTFCNINYSYFHDIALHLKWTHIAGWQYTTIIRRYTYFHFIFAYVLHYIDLETYVHITLVQYANALNMQVVVNMKWVRIIFRIIWRRHLHNDVAIIITTNQQLFISFENIIVYFFCNLAVVL